MRLLSLLIFLTIFSNKALSENIKIDISFIKYGKNVLIDQDFQIFFIWEDSNQKVILEPKIKDGSFVYSTEWSKNIQIIVLKHKNRCYPMYASTIFSGEPEKWIFYYDEKPFNMNYHFSSNLNVKDIEAILCLKHVYNKKDHNALEIIENGIYSYYVYDLKDYKKRSKSIFD